MTDFLTPSDREKLKTWSQSLKIEYRFKFRASIIWKLQVEQLSVTEVADKLETTSKTVRKWRHRFLEKGTKGLLDAPRSGSPQTFTLSQHCELIALACDQPQTEGESGGSWTVDELTLEELDQEFKAWCDDRNRQSITIKWQFTTANACIKLHSLYPKLTVEN